MLIGLNDILEVEFCRSKSNWFSCYCAYQQTEKLLQKVDQSPNSLMQEALDQPMKALVHESLLEHSNVDVKVSAASCICEITRITAPDAPYTDDEMKVQQNNNYTSS